jgi:hypothetical protein
MNLSTTVTTRPPAAKSVVITVIDGKIIEVTKPKRLVSAIGNDSRLPADEPLSEADRNMAAVYWRTTLHQTPSDLPPKPELMVTRHGQCNGDCDDESPSSSLFRHVSNDLEKTHEAFKVHLDMGLKLDCPKCSGRHLGLSEALSYHAHMLECNKVRDDHGALVAARRRCAILKELGYKIA